MDLNSLRITLSPHLQSILEQFEVAQLSVFGSTVRGQAGPDSDVDILVEFSGPTTFDNFMGLKAFLEDILPCKVDLVTTGALTARIAKRVTDEAVRVA